MSLIVVKIVAMCLLGILKLGSGLLPIFLVRVLHFRKSSTMDTFMGIILCVGGGVLISTVFVHMIPEVRESLAHAASLGYMPDSHYAFAELIICLGFFLVFGIEAVVQRFVGGHGHSHGVSAEDPNTKSITSPRDQMELRQGMDNGGFEQENPNGHTKVVSGSETGIVGTPKGRSPFVQNSKTKSFQASGNVYNVSSATLTSYMSYSDGDSMDTSLPSYMPRPNHKTPMTTLESLANEKNILVTIRNFLIVIALSIHSVFEGMAIGLQMTEGDVWKLFTAVSIHSWAILFCIGMDMIVQGTKRLHIIFNIVILALTTPLGIVLGILVTEHVDESSGLQTLVIGILQGVAAGTLLYISFYEVLEKEKLAKAGMTGLLGFFFIFFGFSIMAGLQAIGGHSHGEAMSEDHGHNHGGHAEPQGGHPDHHADHQKEPLDDVDQNVKEALRMITSKGMAIHMEITEMGIMAIHMELIQMRIMVIRTELMGIMTIITVMEATYLMLNLPKTGQGTFNSSLTISKKRQNRGSIPIWIISMAISLMQTTTMLMVIMTTIMERPSTGLKILMGMEITLISLKIILTLMKITIMLMKITTMVPTNILITITVPKTMPMALKTITMLMEITIMDLRLTITKAMTMLTTNMSMKTGIRNPATSKGIIKSMVPEPSESKDT
eukprot:maker-scaffold94_size379870-snap-gene-0.13 protein:Tk09625 transcript:maker-scaffold94_size379870-snap-gene-0.13-mRNA-1 annotation:"zinc transporter zip1"